MKFVVAKKMKRYGDDEKKFEGPPQESKGAMQSLSHTMSTCDWFNLTMDRGNIKAICMMNPYLVV
jgi:hypothetical protein